MMWQPICMHDIALGVTEVFLEQLKFIEESTDSLPKNTAFLKKHINVVDWKTIHVTDAFPAVAVCRA